jgi:hypothetical protein
VTASSPLAAGPVVRRASSSPRSSSAGGRSPCTSRPHLGDPALELAAGAAQQIGGAVGVRPRQGALSGAHTERDRGQLRTEPVVQVAAQAPPLLRHPLHQRAPPVLEVRGQPQRVGHGRQLAGQLVEQPPVARLELGLAAPRRHSEDAERLAVPLQSQLVVERTVRVAGPLDDGAATWQVHPQLDRRQAQRLPHLAGDLLQGCPRGAAALHRGGHVGEHGVRVAAPSVQHAVDGGLHPAPRRREDQRDRHRADEAGHGAAAAEHRRRPADDGGVHHRRHAHQDRTDQRAVDERLDPVQPPAHHGHGDPERQRQAEQVQQPAAGGEGGDDGDRQP